LKQKIIMFFATGFFIGNISVLPGTFGTLVGIPLFFLLAKSSHDIFRQMFHKETVDILILDSELPGRESSSVMRMLEKQYPFLAVVKHVADAKESRWPDPGKKAYVVEKSGNSVETLKRVVKRFILKTGYKSCNGDP